MKKLITGTLLACIAMTASAQELFRFESTPMGPLVAVKDLGAGDRRVRVDITFRLDTYNATDGGHIASGVGDLNRYFDNGVPPMGEGSIVGAWVGCPDKGAAPVVTFESFYSGPALDKDSCFNLPDLKAEYTLTYWVSKDYRVKMRLVQGTTVLFEKERAWVGEHPWHTRGFFLLAVPGTTPAGPYTLLKAVATVEETSKPMPKPP